MRIRGILAAWRQQPGEWLLRGSVQRRLLQLLALCAGITALFGLVAVLVPGALLENRRAHEDAHAIARTLAFALQAPLAFEDRSAINDALGVLRARPEIRGAIAVDRQGRVLATYRAGVRTVGHGLLDGHVTVTVPVVVLGSDTVGHVSVDTGLEKVQRSLALVAALVVLGTGLGFALALLYAHRLARGIVGPIRALAETSARIARDKDYSQRLAGAGDDEIGLAVDAFNRMLDEVRQRDAALAESNRSLEQQRERAVAASQAKTRFVANMSHELRTPLNAVIGAAQLLQQGSVAPRQAHLVDTIRQSGTALLGLIENVLDMSRIESGVLALFAEPFDLQDCVEAAVATAAVAARTKGLAMAGWVAPQVPLWRLGDAVRLRQVLLNLLGNAVKFTSSGEVVLTVDAGDTPAALHISVRDTGIGIDLQRSRDIFEPFAQADDTTSRRFGGTGLGLTISRELIKAMRGTITVHSTPGIGTCFQVSLELPPAPAPAAAETSPLGHRPAAFHEPHEASAQALQALLQRLGLHVTRCRSLDDLARWAGHTAAAGTARWVFMATEPPEAAAWWERATGLLPPDRVVTMGLPDAARADAAAWLAHAASLIKPVRRDAVLQRLRPAPQVRTAPAGTPSAPRRAVRVLVVEDDPINAMIVCSMLDNAGCGHSCADNGAGALAALSQDAGFDVVLMDWNMPDMDGLEVTRRIRRGTAGPVAAAIPIIGLTANAFAEDRLACLNAGMSDFLTKPVLAAALVEAIHRCVAARAPADADTCTDPT